MPAPVSCLAWAWGLESGIGTLLPLNTMELVFGLATLLGLLPQRLSELAGLVVSTLSPASRHLLPLPEPAGL